MKNELGNINNYIWYCFFVFVIAMYIYLYMQDDKQTLKELEQAKKIYQIYKKN